jgi:hypothetical protein
MVAVAPRWEATVRLLPKSRLAQRSSTPVVACCTVSTVAPVAVMTTWPSRCCASSCTGQPEMLKAPWGLVSSGGATTSAAVELAVPPGRVMQRPKPSQTLPPLQSESALQSKAQAATLQWLPQGHASSKRQAVGAARAAWSTAQV